MNMLIDNWPIVGLAILVLLGILAARSIAKPVALPYQRRDALATAAELRFFHVLREACGEEWLVFAKVRIADLLAVKPETQKAISWQNRINCKHIDFVICDPESLVPEAAVELDDKSHQRADRVARDQFVNAAFAAARLPLLRVPVQREYSAEAIRQQIHQQINGARKRQTA